jgi:hyperosmotically inducible periplasmic protein
MAESFAMKKFSANASSLITFAGLALLSICICSALAQNSSSQQPGVSNRTSQTASDLGEGRTAKDLIGKNVENKNGDKIGSVKDLVVDTRSGRVDFVIISSGGVAGIGSHQKAVPASAISTATTKKDTLALDVTQDAWKAAPDFDKNQLASLGDRAQRQQIYQYYKQSPPASAQIPANVLPPTGRDSGQYNPGQPGNRLQLASDLIGKSVVNRQGQDVGKVSDLLVDISNPKATLAIIKPGSLITDKDKQAGKQLFAIPVNSLNAGGDNNKVVSDVTADQFQQAQPFDAGSWAVAGAAAGTPHVFRYQASDNNTSSSSSTDVDNTRRNERDRQPGAVTPMTQSESKEDLQLTANIRRAVVKDDTLSTAAKNIKIISANGKVVLRGPVHSDQEKSEIQKLAEQTAGAGNVENDLEVKQD